MASNIDVLVIGSLNHDIVAVVDTAPGPGATVLARSLTRTNGGKGGNQAVAAARAGAVVRMVSSVGVDAEGEMQVNDLLAYGVDPSGVVRQPDLRTSLALIWITPDGENSIIVTPGAKDRVTPELVRTAASNLGNIKVVLAQSEVGAAVSDAAADLAGQLSARFVLSCGPVVLPSLMTLRRCDPIIVNAQEARDLLKQLGADVTTSESMLADALLQVTQAASVIVTLGARGSLAAQNGMHSIAIPAQPTARVVDTTGAGDTYAGVVAARLSLGDELGQACHEAAMAAAACVGWFGARPGTDQ